MTSEEATVFWLPRCPRSPRPDRSLDQLVSLMEVASFLDITSLVTLLCAQISVLLKNKKIEELREIFEESDDLTNEDIIS